jgi:hypothetical protein
MSTLFKRIRNICSQVNTSLGFWEESGDYDIEEAMWLKEYWLESMAQANDEFSAYKDLVSVWANAELTRSGSNYTVLSDYLEDTKTWVDEAIADQAIADKAIVRYNKATGQGNQYNKADVVELEVQYEVCGNVPEESCSNVLKEVCQDVAKDVLKWQRVEFTCAIALGCYGVLRNKFSREDAKQANPVGEIDEGNLGEDGVVVNYTSCEENCDEEEPR